MSTPKKMSKECTQCGETKPLDAFSKRPICKKCRAAKERQARAAGSRKPDKRQRSDRPPEYEEYLARPEVKDRQRELDRARYYRNRPERLFRSKLRTGEQRGYGGHITFKEAIELFDAQNKCCHYCKDPLLLEEAGLDHKNPLSRGGTNTIDNVVISCWSCNQEKKVKTYEEFTNVA